jgi:hypothetical protein
MTMYIQFFSCICIVGLLRPITKQSVSSQYTNVFFISFIKLSFLTQDCVWLIPGFWGSLSNILVSCLIMCPACVSSVRTNILIHIKQSRYCRNFIKFKQIPSVVLQAIVPYRSTRTCITFFVFTFTTNKHYRETIQQCKVMSSILATHVIQELLEAVIRHCIENLKIVRVTSPIMLHGNNWWSADLQHVTTFTMGM